MPKEKGYDAMCVVAFLLNPLPILFLYQSYASLYEICQVLTL